MENPREFAETTLCPECVYSEEVDPYISWLLHYLALRDAGCPLGRHELTNQQWKDLHTIEIERNIIMEEKRKEAGKEAED